jgi:site-specific DNA recombinase
VLDALKSYHQADVTAGASALIGLLERGRTRLRITLADADRPRQEITIAWLPEQKRARPMVEGSDPSNDERNESLTQSIVRAHAWISLLQGGTYGGIEELAVANDLHPKVVRQNLRLAFLSPEITSVILEGSQPANLSLAGIPKLLSPKWTDHRSLLG